ncbi:MAG TPA: hypothetical protein VLQ80_12905, partial [Candidatus Saccharimonadia bacterium]|nr:hypothetical protein [Candidatus Saccharimonadia bacterium]
MHTGEAEDGPVLDGHWPATLGGIPDVLQRVVQEGAGRAQARLSVSDLQLNTRFITEGGCCQRRRAGGRWEEGIQGAPGDACRHRRLAYRKEGTNRQLKHGGRLQRGLAK